MKSLTGMSKFFFLLLLICSFFVCTIPIYLFWELKPKRVRNILIRIVSYYSQVMAFILDIEIDSANFKKLESNYFIVCNHLSYLDMIIISSLIPTCYVTSVEMGNIPVLGQIAKLAGCLFVERRNKSNIENEIKDIEDALSQGFNVTVFPEATSTNGEKVLNFKRSLFASATNTDSKIMPLTINYKSINSSRMDINKRDLVCWYDDMSFLPHLFKLCFQKNIKVEIEVGGELLSENYDFDPAKLRDRAFEVVSRNYCRIA